MKVYPIRKDATEVIFWIILSCACSFSFSKILALPAFLIVNRIPIKVTTEAIPRFGDLESSGWSPQWIGSLLGVLLYVVSLLLCHRFKKYSFDSSNRIATLMWWILVFLGISSLILGLAGLGSGAPDPNIY